MPKFRVTYRIKGHDPEFVVTVEIPEAAKLGMILDRIENIWPLIKENEEFFSRHFPSQGIKVIRVERTYPTLKLEKPAFGGISTSES